MQESHLKRLSAKQASRYNTDMQLRRERWLVGILIFVFLALITLPFVYASLAADSNHAFGGFLLNPIDGNSYLAKMREGYDGAWLFTLPYTAQPGAGAAINLYYVFLGHVARWSGLSLIIVFHTARLFGSLLLSLALYRFFRSIIREALPRLLAFALALFGSGLGWLALVFGAFTSDFWVAEAYPFLSTFSNAHFPMGLALQIVLLTPLDARARFGKKQTFLAAAGAALLSIIYPFGWIVAVLILAVWLFWQAVHRAKLAGELARWLSVFLGGLPFAMYSLWVVYAQPILRQWTQQNLTPAPAPLDLLIALSPAFLLALLGAYRAFRTNNKPFLFLGFWFLIGLLLVYFPGNLQRRFMSGLYVPVVGLALFALDWQRENQRQFRTLAVALTILSLLTNVILVTSGLQASHTQNAALYLQRTELNAFQWLDEHASGAVVLASADSGLFIPAYSSARVIYGHPFETAEADARRPEVLRFFGELTSIAAEDYLRVTGVDYVFYGPRERTLGPLPVLLDWNPVYSADGIEIWAPDP
jgi:hypothetical protein